YAWTQAHWVAGPCPLALVENTERSHHTASRITDRHRRCRGKLHLRVRQLRTKGGGAEILFHQGKTPRQQVRVLEEARQRRSPAGAKGLRQPGGGSDHRPATLLQRDHPRRRG